MATRLVQGAADESPHVPVAAEAIASWLYAIDFGANDGSSTLLRLGTSASGGFVDLQVVGETGVENIFDIAFMGTRLFGVGPGLETFGILDDVLVEINPTTGTATPIGTIDTSATFNALVGETSSTLLAANTAGEVWRFNPGALTATHIGDFGGTLVSSGDLAFALDGLLYGIADGGSSDRLIRVAAGTGFATVVGATGFRDVFGLTVNPTNGDLLAVVDGDDDPRLARVNRATGAVTVIGRIPTTTGITGLASAPTSTAACIPSPSTHCLTGGRFRVRVNWTTPSGQTGGGAVLAFNPPLDDSGAFWFFGQNNVELIVKVLNACALNNRFWVFAGGLTNVRTRLVIEDTQTGTERVYENPQNKPFQPIQDTSAFATCP